MTCIEKSLMMFVPHHNPMPSSVHSSIPPLKEIWSVLLNDVFPKDHSIQWEVFTYFSRPITIILSIVNTDRPGWSEVTAHFIPPPLPSSGLSLPHFTHPTTDSDSVSQSPALDTHLQTLTLFVSASKAKLETKDGINCFICIHRLSVWRRDGSWLPVWERYSPYICV